MTSRIRISKEKQLLVEGNDQRNFFEALAAHLGISESVQIHNFGGVDELRGFLAAFVKMPNFNSVRSVGIVRDAEASEPAAFQSVQSSLTNADLPAPTLIGRPIADDLTVAVLVLPGDGNPGMLETILCRTFHGQEVNRCVDDFFECVENMQDVSIGHPDKARAYAYLATRPDAHHSVGVAAKAGVWNLDHPAFGDVREFLIAL